MQTKENDTNFIITSAIKLIVGLIAIIYARPISKSFAKNDSTGQPE
ncbi:MAG: hypothetical protein IPP32_14140 [Bacteroidetes bacterium]|nr:hypothetical protein [Bacteroidota bacterium]